MQSTGKYIKLVVPTNKYNNDQISNSTSQLHAIYLNSLVSLVQRYGSIYVDMGLRLMLYMRMLIGLTIRLLTFVDGIFGNIGLMWCNES